MGGLRGSAGLLTHRRRPNLTESANEGAIGGMFSRCIVDGLFFRLVVFRAVESAAAILGATWRRGATLDPSACRLSLNHRTRRSEVVEAISVTREYMWPEAVAKRADVMPEGEMSSPASPRALNLGEGASKWLPQ